MFLQRQLLVEDLIAAKVTDIPIAQAHKEVRALDISQRVVLRSYGLWSDFSDINRVFVVILPHVQVKLVLIREDG
jgi:hypothetical protein